MVAKRPCKIEARSRGRTEAEGGGTRAGWLCLCSLSSFFSPLYYKCISMQNQANGSTNREGGKEEGRMIEVKDIQLQMRQIYCFALFGKTVLIRNFVNWLHSSHTACDIHSTK